MSAAALAQYWYFHVPNFVLAAVIYTILGRLVLGLVVPEDWDNYIWRGFRRITDPVLGVIRALTPAVLGHHIVLIFAVLWLMALRIVFFAVMATLGLVPRLAG